MSDTTTLTDDQLHAAITEATTQAQSAQAEQADRLAELHAEQQRRTHEAQQKEKQARQEWAEWFLDGGGYTQLKAQRTTEEREARQAFLTALRESPLGQAAARYYAAVESKQHAIDLREQASTILGRSFNAVNYQNRTDLVAEAVDQIQREAAGISAEAWDELTETQNDTQARTWIEGGKAPEQRTEEYTVPGPEDYGKPVTVRLNVITGTTEIVDPEFTQWKADQEANAEHPAAPPAWAHNTQEDS